MQSHGKVPGLWFVLNRTFLKRLVNVWREFSFLSLFKTQDLALALKSLPRAERSLAWLCCTGANPTFHSCAEFPLLPQLGGLLKGGSSSEALLHMNSTQLRTQACAHPTQVRVSHNCPLIHLPRLTFPRAGESEMWDIAVLEAPVSFQPCLKAHAGYRVAGSYLVPCEWELL